jgi:hypothetical protein
MRLGKKSSSLFSIYDSLDKISTQVNKENCNVTRAKRVYHQAITLRFGYLSLNKECEQTAQYL